MRKLILAAVTLGLAFVPGLASAQTVPSRDASLPGAYIPGAPVADMISRVDVGDGSTVVVQRDGTISREWNSGAGYVLYPDGSLTACALNTLVKPPHLHCDPGV